MVAKAQRRRCVEMMALGAVTPAEVATHLGVSVQAVYRWIDATKAREARALYAEYLLARGLAEKIGKRRLREIAERAPVELKTR